MATRVTAVAGSTSLLLPVVVYIGVWTWDVAGCLLDGERGHAHAWLTT